MQALLSIGCPLLHFAIMLWCLYFNVIMQPSCVGETLHCIFFGSCSESTGCSY